MTGAPELATALWAALGAQQAYFTEPVQVHPDPIWRMTTREDFMFDDAFWEVFEQFPFSICHVSHEGAPEFTLRFAPRRVVDQQVAT